MDQQKDRHTEPADDLGIDPLYGHLPPILEDHPILALAVAHLPLLAALVGSLPDPLLDSGHG